jgi:hypothetical protein
MLVVCTVMRNSLPFMGPEDSFRIIYIYIFIYLFIYYLTANGF